MEVVSKGVYFKVKDELTIVKIKIQIGNEEREKNDLKRLIDEDVFKNEEEVLIL